MAHCHGNHQQAMPSPLTIFLCAALFTLLGMGWMKGYDFVKAKAPEQIVKFYLAYAVFRVLAILLVVGVYVLFISKSMAQSKAFAIMVFVMYASMMALTLTKKH